MIIETFQNSQGKWHFRFVTKNTGKPLYISLLHYDDEMEARSAGAQHLLTQTFGM